jgi:hypothetical protein
MWRYEQRTGSLSQKTTWVSGHAPVVFTGYAGKGAGKNSPIMQDVEAVGPLPRGRYTIGAPVTHATVGVYALPLTPDPRNEMYGRSGFFIHGDSLDHPGEASHGCLVFSRSVRELIWKSGDHVLEVAG